MRTSVSNTEMYFNFDLINRIQNKRGPYSIQTIIVYILYKIFTLYTRPVRTNFFFAILKTFTSVTIMYAMMNKCLTFFDLYLKYCYVTRPFYFNIENIQKLTWGRYRNKFYSIFIKLDDFF